PRAPAPRWDAAGGGTGASGARRDLGRAAPPPRRPRRGGGRVGVVAPRRWWRRAIREQRRPPPNLPRPRTDRGRSGEETLLLRPAVQVSPARTASRGGTPHLRGCCARGGRCGGT